MLQDIEGTIRLKPIDSENYLVLFSPALDHDAEESKKTSIIFVGAEGLLDPSTINILVSVEGRLSLKDGINSFLEVTKIRRNNASYHFDVENLGSKINTTNGITGIVTHVSSIFLHREKATGII